MNAALTGEQHDPPTPLLKVSDLNVSFALPHTTVSAVKNVSFTLAPGERAALVGESGSGKTTVAMAIAGFLTKPYMSVTADALEFDGTAMSVRPGRMPKRIPGLTMVFQDAMTSLDQVWTIGSQLAAVVRASNRGDDGKKLSRRQTDALCREWLRKVGLVDTDTVMRKRPYELSGGMRQRVMLALALCGTPRLLIADEPTSALDATLSRTMMELMAELTDETGAALLIVSHDINLCQEFADQTMVMYAGEMVEKGTSAQLRDNPSHPYTRGLLECVPTLDNADWDRLPTLADVGSGAFDPTFAATRTIPTSVLERSES
jgi:ABC-type dipeptide/oligopeptide/nickel transport system ATPase component